VEPARVREAFRGSLIRVEIQEWRGPDRQREVVRHPGAVGVVALTPEGRVILVRQLREAVGDVVLEIPAGIRDVSGEPAEATARREVSEETGYAVQSLRPLGRLHTSPGFTDESIEMFVAEVAPGGPPERGIERVELSMDEAVDAVATGRITDAKTVAGILLASREPNLFPGHSPE
jgi:ADP-ribose pyrophosphatase